MIIKVGIEVYFEGFCGFFEPVLLVFFFLLVMLGEIYASGELDPGFEFVEKVEFEGDGWDFVFAN